MSAPRTGLVGAATARAEAHVLRLSLIYALLDGAGTVAAPHLESALAFWDYSARSAAHIFGDATGNPTADTILGALRDHGRLDRTQIGNLFGRHKSAAEIAHALSVLARAGRARMTSEDTGGRPREVRTRA